MRRFMLSASRLWLVAAATAAAARPVGAGGSGCEGLDFVFGQWRWQPPGLSGAVAQTLILPFADGSPPVFSAENRWTYRDGDTTIDATPTISLLDYWDDTGIARADFYWRPGASNSDADWQLAGRDSDLSDGLWLTYPDLGPGVYDLGVRVWDLGNRITDWHHRDDAMIDDLVIDPSATPVIRVACAATKHLVNRRVFSNNVMWHQWSALYNPDTGRLPDALEQRVAEMGMPMLRYPGGCFSDTFYWKQSIGPVDQRPDQYTNGCSTQTWNQGPAKFGLDEFLRFCEERDIEPVFTLRFRWPDAPGAPFDGPDPYGEALADAADLIEYCNAHNDGANPGGGTDWAAQRAANGHPQPYRLRYLELGNEPWGPDPWGSPTPWGPEAAAVYANTFSAYADVIHAIDPAVKLSAAGNIRARPDLDPQEPTWDSEVYRLAGGACDLIHPHPYYPYSAWEPDLDQLYRETMATSRAIDQDLQLQKRYLLATYPERAGELKLTCSEHNINYGWSLDPDQGRINRDHSYTLKAAVALVDVFRVFVENADLIDSAHYWHLYGGGPWGNIASGDYHVNPTYYAFRTMNHHFGETVIDCHVTASPLFDYTNTGSGTTPSQRDLSVLTAMASIDNNGRAAYLVVINKDQGADVTATVDVGDFVRGGETASLEIWTLNGPSPDSDNRTDPNTVTITESAATEGAVFSYTFPAHSVTSFKMIASRQIMTASDTSDRVGWHLIGLPLDPVDPAPEAVFAGILTDDRLYRYDNNTRSYVAYRSATPESFGDVHPGEGYWLWFDGPTTVEYQGYGSGPVWSAAIGGEGWHLMGKPHEAGNALVDLTADGAPIVGGEYLDLPLWGYRGSGYFAVGVDPWQSSALEAWHGYWVYAWKDECQLTVPNAAWP